MFKAGEYVHNGEYATFVPVHLNDEIKLSNPKIFNLTIDAARYLGELNAYSQFVQDIDFFIEMSIFREATSSNRIEGTTTNLQEAFMSKAALKTQEQRDDWDEVHNYIKALKFATKQLEKERLDCKLICKTHQILLSGVRGKDKAPGRLRWDQNWIGGVNPAQAIFVPPEPKQVKSLMSNLDDYWHNPQGDIHVLQKIAITHYQFETIHPFFDGNGRMGRLLMSLQLIDKKFLIKPAFYLSEYLEDKRQAYYEALNFTRHSEHGLDQWIEFCLTGIIETSRKASRALRDSLNLRDLYNNILMQNLSPVKQQNATKLLNYLFSQPIVGVDQVSSILKCSRQTASTLINDLCQLKILSQLGSKSRYRDFVLHKYLHIFTN